MRAWGPGVLFAIALTSASASAAPIAVRHAESATHGFLVLRGANGDVLAHGEFVQAPVKGQRMESRLVFRFRASTDVTFDRDSGRYRARVDDKTDEDKIELPEDLHNGITGTLLKNLAPGGSAAGHTLAFTPQPHRLDTTLRAEGEDRFLVGDVARTATRYLVKMELRGLKVRYWISTGSAPGFVKFEGPMFLNGPRWRVELTGPRWPER